MTRFYEGQVAWRYTRSGGNESFITFISNVSIAGIALGVAVLIVVMSVMNGFEAELRERILSIASHATISGSEGRLPQWESVRSVADENDESCLGRVPPAASSVLLLESSWHPVGVTLVPISDLEARHPKARVLVGWTLRVYRVCQVGLNCWNHHGKHRLFRH